MKRLNRWAKDQPILQFVVQMALVVLLTDATVETGLLRIEWLHDLVWFLVPIAWAAVSVALALFSKNMWDVIKARQEDRRQKMEDLEREREKERQHLEKERALREEKQHLAAKIWQECKDDAVAIQVARDSGDIVQSRIKTAQLAGKLQGLDPFLA